jgi:type II secretory pathway component PulK
MSTQRSSNTPAPPADRRQRGVVLFIVLFFILLLTATVATFVRRVAIDAGISVNRDRAVAAEALARGGIRLAEAMLLEDLRLDAETPQPDSRWDVWARAHLEPIFVDEESDLSLHLEIEDAATRLNLNALVGAGGSGLGSPATGDAAASGRTAPVGGTAGTPPAQGQNPLGGGRSSIETRRLFLSGFLERVIDGMPGRPEDKLYAPQELAAALVDWVDADDVRQDGGSEDEFYQQQDPPYRASNLPLLSIDELRLVDGFDAALVEALRPYVAVWPLAGGGGINLNTAPSWVLAQLTVGTDVSGMRPLEEDDVGRILDLREEGVLCSTAEAATDCTPIQELFGGETISPPMLDRSSFFLVRATARVVDVERRIEAVLDRSDPTAIRRLAWRVR